MFYTILECYINAGFSVFYCVCVLWVCNKMYHLPRIEEFTYTFNRVQITIYQCIDI